MSYSICIVIVAVKKTTGIITISVRCVIFKALSKLLWSGYTSAGKWKWWHILKQIRHAWKKCRFECHPQECTYPLLPNLRWNNIGLVTKTKSMEYSPSAKANSRSAGQEIPCLVLETKIHCRFISVSPGLSSLKEEYRLRVSENWVLRSIMYLDRRQRK
jgi:hypothetical protein